MYHFIGIKGTGMASLANILHDLGYEVQGSDKGTHFFTEDILVEKGIKILPFNSKNIKKDMIIVQGNAFGDENEEVLKAKELDLKIYTYQEMLAKLTKMFNTITVAGSHGKTTTTSMISKVLSELVGANYLIGDGTGHGDKESKYFVLEACEWKRHFLEYFPDYAIITNIDLDHIDYYKDISDIIDAFNEYANNAEKMVIACGDDQYTRSLEVNRPIFYYGMEEGNDILAKDVEFSSDGISFDVEIEGNYYGHFDLPLFGKHMLLDALACIAVCYYERLDAKEVGKVLKTFKGAKRRFTENVIGDIVTIADYAHHPNEVKVTIKGARQKYPNKTIVAVLLVHTLSRAGQFSTEFADALNLADYSYIMDIYTDRVEVGYDDVTYEDILKKLKNGKHITNDEKGAEELLQYKDAVILFMSSKEIYVLQDAYEELLIKKMEEENE